MTDAPMTQTPSSTERRLILARWLFVAACGAAAILVVQSARSTDPPIQPTPPPDELIATDAPIAPDVLMREPGAEPGRLFRPRPDTPLQGDPGGVAPPPGADTLLATQRTNGPWTEQQAVYRIAPNADNGASDPDRPTGEAIDTEPLADRIVRHYEAAATAAGYAVKPTAATRPGGETESGSAAIARLFVAERRTLLVTVRAMDDHVRATVLCRVASAGVE